MHVRPDALGGFRALSRSRDFASRAFQVNVGLIYNGLDARPRNDDQTIVGLIYGNFSAIYASHREGGRERHTDLRVGPRIWTPGSVDEIAFLVSPTSNGSTGPVERAGSTTRS